MSPLARHSPPQTTAKDSLGCTSSGFLTNIERQTALFGFYRKHTTGLRLEQVSTPASGRGILIGISLSDGHRRKIIRGSRSATHDFRVDSIYARDFSEDYRADMVSNFNFMLIELSPMFLDGLADGSRRAGLDGIAPTVAHDDRLLGQLGRALALALQSSDAADAMLLDQLGMAIGTHAMHAYGGVPCDEPKQRQRLSAQLEMRAKEMLTTGAMSIDEIANACRVSRSYFIKAFSATTGKTPHQWLIEQRIDTAKHLLAHGDWTLARIAEHCGFSSQSHFTQTFTKVVGLPPGGWRRRARA
ncbi:MULTISPECIES: helix-turn-helix domain-containing protein [Burkholderia]|uniref:AraC family transcriptional regulator n=1 Tax=Burkholderia mayonis TaxID=1385591 RepID=A0A1B4FK67_9BURK|nr:MULTISPECIES: helix-turn-helix transcriptional regulator [Burkholderia]AOJ04076.1 AraC family transcriptional regulator [Burkholderia mayonis]KVE45576.1 AraC family transcriptional regulator [Burkholderia sp. BDU5]KVE46095.1 AraC family transcriptional regulator [Burkholderia mayonis]